MKISPVGHEKIVLEARNGAKLELHDAKDKLYIVLLDDDNCVVEKVALNVVSIKVEGGNDEERRVHRSKQSKDTVSTL